MLREVLWHLEVMDCALAALGAVDERGQVFVCNGANCIPHGELRTFGIHTIAAAAQSMSLLRSHRMSDGGPDCCAGGNDVYAHDSRN